MGDINIGEIVNNLTHSCPNSAETTEKHDLVQGENVEVGDRRVLWSIVQFWV